MDDTIQEGMYVGEIPSSSLITITDEQGVEGFDAAPAHLEVTDNRGRYVCVGMTDDEVGVLHQRIGTFIERRKGKKQ